MDTGLKEKFNVTFKVRGCNFLIHVTQDLFIAVDSCGCIVLGTQEGRFNC